MPKGVKQEFFAKTCLLVRHIHAQASAGAVVIYPPFPSLGVQTAWSGLAWPGLAWPGLAWPGLAWPGLALPGLAWPGLAWPCLAWPGLAWPGLAIHWAIIW